MITRYEDVHHEWHDADPESLAVVVDQLDADAALDTSVIEPVHVGGGAVVAGADVRDVQLVLHDGTELDIVPDPDRRRLP
ncbi:MAG TPA: hypothetical protein VF142_02405, partial [Longimicrobium sp.]